MSYTLDNLGAKNFEHLVQALSKKILGEGVSIYGAGPDGQREATFNGKAPYPSSVECWDGCWIIQAKFKEPLTKKADYPWLKECFEDEMKNFAEKKNNGKKLPDNYLFFTNVVLTPVAEKGIKDKIDNIAEQYKDLIPHIHIIGADDITKFLDGNRDVATAYASYILSGDILAYLYENVQGHEKERQNAFFRYLAQAFDDDYCSRMEQAGQVTEEKVSIDKVYIDLDFKFEETENEAKFIKHAINVGNKIYRFSTAELQKLNYAHETNTSNKYVLKGSAGQGKSTVCQFLAQIYRATFIRNFCGAINPKIGEFIDRICEDNINLPTCCRIPIRVELRLYSSWMINRQKENKSIDLVTYISSIIAEKAAQKFDNETLRLYFKKYSWVFFFDGLDEVPESSNRKELMAEIDRFIEIELRQADTDAMFFATTRPEGYVGEFSKSNFTHIDLIPLNKTSCFIYLNKLLNAIEDDSTKRNSYIEILKQGLDNKQIAFMMQTPLQATIIAILVRAGGEPPRDKYSLFKEYFDIILKREKQKGMGSILNNNQDLVEGVYYLLGYELQKRSSTTEGSDALISLNRMKELIKEMLAEDGIDENANNYNQLLNDTYAMIVHRINFASEIKEGYIGFSIRSMQEFLAAVHIVKTVDDDGLGILLKDLAKSSYWKNTFIFLVECIAKMKVYYLDHLIDTILGELNGSALHMEQMSEIKSVHYGSQVAFVLLSNNIFKNKPKYENKLCKYIEEFSRLEFWDDMSPVLTMSDNVKSELTNYLLNKDNHTNADFALASLLIQDEKMGLMLKDFSQSYASEIATQYFRTFNSSCPEALYGVVKIAIENGSLLDLSLEQITDIITNIKDIQSKQAKETIFKITLKGLLNCKLFIEPKVDLINEFFECDFLHLFNIRKNLREEVKITEDFKIQYLLPKANGFEFEKIISLADLYSLDGLSLVLKTLGSSKIASYIEFYENAGKYKEEVYMFNEETLIRQNRLMWNLWQKAIFDVDYDLNELLGEDVVNILNCNKTINTLSDWLEECKKDFFLHTLSITLSKDVFVDFISQIHEACEDLNIKQYPILCYTFVFILSCQYEYIYRQEVSDYRNETLESLDEYIGQVFEYSQSESTFSIWKKYLWCIVFLKIQGKNFMNYANSSFAIPEYLKNKVQSFPFSAKDSEKMLKNLVLFIYTSGNLSAFDFLYDYISTSLDYDTLLKIDWDNLASFEQKRVCCLKEISEAKTRDDVVKKVLPLLEDVETSDLIFNLLLRENLPEHFLPIYIYYLDKYRDDNQIEYVKQLEQKIRDYITKTSINI